MKKVPFPKTIHVTLEGQGTKDWYYEVHNEDGGFRRIEDTKTVAVYKLVAVGRVVVNKTFKPGGPGR
jgi:hypothetical protein